MMKNWIKLVAIVATAALSTACSNRDDADVDYYLFHITYDYVNSCTTDLTVKSYSVYFDKKTDQWISKDSIFVINRNSKHSIYYEPNLLNGTPGGPLVWTPRLYYGNNTLSEDRKNNRDSTVVSNGSKQLIYRRMDWDDIYFSNHYTLIDHKENKYTYQWTFTDADFENGEPIDKSQTED